MTRVGETRGFGFLKWAGGKQWLATKLAAVLPQDMRTYYEPFLGGGSLFFACQPNRAHLSDANAALIETYQVVRDSPTALIAKLATWPHSRRFYYSLRGMRSRSSVVRAARFIYLNRTCWNGLYRVNKRGEFNVPYGRFSNPTICDSEALNRSHRLLSSADFAVADFEAAVRTAGARDLVFLDPPYTVRHSNNGFLRYNESIFSWRDQARLADTAKRLAARGCHVIVSNAWHSEVLALYRGFHTTRVRRLTRLAADSSKRGVAFEAILSSFRIRADLSQV